jgi:hypothetical protein
MTDPVPSQSEADFRFLALVMSLATAAWSQLGKIAHPQTNQIEKDLEQAKITIDFLRMLLEKTEGNLTPKEKDLLSKAVTDLELNYADEADKLEPIPAAQNAGPILVRPDGSPASSTKGPDIILPK